MTIQFSWPAGKSSAIMVAENILSEELCTSIIDESSKYNVLSNPTHSGEMYLSGLQALNKNCNFKNATEEDNRLYLGDLNGSIPDSVFIVDSIPLDNFTIYNSRH